MAEVCDGRGGLAAIASKQLENIGGLESRDVSNASDNCDCMVLCFSGQAHQPGSGQGRGDGMGASRTRECDLITWDPTSTRPCSLYQIQPRSESFATIFKQEPSTLINAQITGFNSTNTAASPASGTQVSSVSQCWNSCQDDTTCDFISFEADSTEDPRGPGRCWLKTATTAPSSTLLAIKPLQNFNSQVENPDIVDGPDSPDPTIVQGDPIEAPQDTTLFKAGIAVGCVVFVALVGMIVFLIYHRKKQNRKAAILDYMREPVTDVPAVPPIPLKESDKSEVPPVLFPAPEYINTPSGGSSSGSNSGSGSSTTGSGRNLLTFQASGTSGSTLGESAETTSGSNPPSSSTN